MAGQQHKRPMQRIKQSIYFCTLFILLYVPQQSFSGEEAKSTIKIENLKNKYKSKKSKLSKNESKNREILSDIYKVNRKIRKLRFKTERLTNEILSYRGKIKDLAKEVVRKERGVEASKKDLGEVFRWVYKQDRKTSFLSLLFSAKNPRDLQRVNDSMSKLSRDQVVKIKAYESEIQSLQQSKTLLQADVEKLLNVDRKLKVDEDLLDEEQHKKSRLLQIVRSQYKKYRNEIKEIREEVSIQSPTQGGILQIAFFERKGKMKPPVEGIIEKSFGLDYNETFKTKHIHKGVFFKVKAGTKVIAQHSGGGVFCGVVPGNGKSVLLSHGDHYYTLYANNQKLNVKLGQTVPQGGVIAKTGFSQTHNGNGLYFEIRHYSEALDPQKWFAVNKIKTVATVDQQGRGAPIEEH